MTPLPSPSSSPPRPSPLVTALGPALVLLATLLVFWPALRGALVYDDLLIVGRNHTIRDLGNLPQLLSSPYWDFLGSQDAEQIGYWRPLTGVAHAVSYAIGHGDPWAFHALGLAIHLLATLVAWFLARRLTGNLWIAAGTALLFGLHPTHVESVAWISALNDPLFGLFALLAVAAHLRWRERGSRGVPLAAALWFLLALGAKELGAAVLPLVLAVELGRRRGEDEPDGALGGLHAPWRAYLPFGIVLALYFLARVLVFASPWAGFDRVTTDFGVGWSRLLTLRLELLGGSLELLALPAAVEVFRPFHAPLRLLGLDPQLFRPFRPALSLFSPDLLRAMLWTGIATAGGVLLWRRRRRPALAALLIIPAGLLPVLLRVESLGSFPLSDRFLYVPVLGFGLLLSLFFFRVLPRAAATVLLVAIGALYAVADRARIATFANEEVLFTTAARETPACPYVLWGLGRVLLDRADRLEDRAALARAFQVYTIAGHLLDEAKEPGSNLFVSSRDFLQVNLGLGWCYMIEANLSRSPSYSAAIAVFEQVAAEMEKNLDLARKAEEAGYRVVNEHLELELVYHALGLAHLLAGDLEQAEPALRRALALRRDFAPANHALGKLFMQKGQYVAARKCFEKALAQRPGAYDDRYWIARSLVEGGKVSEAAAMARTLVEDFPRRADPMVLLAGAALQRRDWREALRWVDRALDVDPNHGYAWFHKANALLLRNQASATAIEGSGAEVLEAYRNAATLLPGNFEAHYQLAAYLLHAGALEAALPPLVRAYELCTRPDLLAALRQELQGIPDPTPDLLRSLARIDARRDELDLAESWLDAALRLDPDDVDALLQKGRVLRRRGRHSEAVELLRHACRLRAASYELLSELGAYLAELGRRDEAIEILERACALPPAPGVDPRLAASSRAALRKRIAALRKEGGAVGPSPPHR